MFHWNCISGSFCWWPENDKALYGLRRLMARVQKTSIFTIAVFLLFFNMKFGTELENDQYVSF